MLLGIGLSSVLALAGTGKITSHKWTAAQGTAFVLAAIVVSWGLVLTAQSPSAEQKAARRRRFRNDVIVFVATVAISLIVFKILDAMHIAWQQYVP